MSDIHIRTQGCAGRISFQRPKALNALTYDMLRAIEAALIAWRDDATVSYVIFDAEGDKAFCAGGDIADLYAAGKAGDYAFGQTFWRDEYRLNAMIATYPKPTISFMQGFIMGGGVGVGCHCRHRIVGATSQIAMPECSIGLVPDVGGSLILAKAPGRLGEYLGMTGARMGPIDAIYAGFADHYLDETDWPATIAALCAGKAPTFPQDAPQPSPLQDQQAEIERLFAGSSLSAIIATLQGAQSEFAAKALKLLAKNSPLSTAATLLLLTRVRAEPTIHNALTQEYRFTARASEQGDFIEGIRAAIIDKDRSPNWRHSATDLSNADIEAMLAPLGEMDLTWKDTP